VSVTGEEERKRYSLESEPTARTMRAHLYLTNVRLSPPAGFPIPRRLK